jgi:exocyst complex component 2
MNEMRSILFAKLQDPTRSVEEQEKTIEYVESSALLGELRIVSYVYIRILLELDSAEDPAWTCLDSYHEHIMSQMKKACTSATTTIECM